MVLGIEPGPSRIALQPALSTFNARLQVQLFLQDLNVTATTTQRPEYLGLKTFQVLLSVAFEDSPSCTSQDLLAALSAVISTPGITEYVLRRFRPLLVDLIARWTEVEEAEAEEWERRLFVIAESADQVPEHWNLLHGFLTTSPFLTGSPLALCPTYDALLTLPPLRLQLLLLSYNRLLTADPLLAKRQKYLSSPLIILYTSYPDAGVRLLAVQCYARLTGLLEVARRELEEKFVGGVKDTEARVGFGWRVVTGEKEEGSRLEMREIDGWVLRLGEHQLRLRYQHFLAEEQDFYATSPYNQTIITDSDLSTRTASIGDIITFRPLKRTQSLDTPETLHVSTPSGNTTIQRMMHALDRRLPLLLSSPPSAGKTHLIHYLSSKIYPGTPSTTRILTIALADTSIDAKALLGSYVSSPTEPGTFIWAEGALTKAVRSGRWVVLEDLDRASQEIQSLFSGLADELGPQKSIGARARLTIPGKDTVEAGDGFALIATRSLGSKHMTPPTFLGHNYFYEVTLEPPTVEEVREILDAGFPRLQGDPAAALLDVYLRLAQPGTTQKGGGQQSGQSHSKGRILGLRDLQKWCARINKLLPSSGTIAMRRDNDVLAFANPILQDEVFLEATDIFVGSFDSSSTTTGRERKMDIAKIIADSIGLGQERYAFLVGQRIPQMQIVGDVRARNPIELHIGRCCLRSLPAGPVGVEKSDRPFALTKPSLVLLERLAVGVSLAEPILLVGETGTGKTTAVQHLSGLLRRPLTVLNLSTQTESGDLLGGFKPIDAALPGRELHSRWIDLFRRSFSRRKNESYEGGVRKAINDGRWKRVAEMWTEAAKLAQDRLGKRVKTQQRESSPKRSEQAVTGGESPRKRRKIDDMEISLTELLELLDQWEHFVTDVKAFDLQHVRADNKLVFSFVEGPLVKALKNGEWILLDEVNLASQETLESLTTILENNRSSVILTERGDLEPVARHPDFRLFACMNPATDVGKKDLPPGLRARFTEIYVPPPDDDREALLSIVKQYLGDAVAGDRSAILDVAEFYISIKALAKAKEIVDGSNIPPHYSMRTLARALMFAVEVSPLFGLRRALWEGCLMTFTMSLDAESALRAKLLAQTHLLSGLRNIKATMAQVPTLPKGVDPDDFLRFGHFWLQKGPMPIPADETYVLTPSVEAKLADLARVILTRRFPVLIQGPTSSGKTSAVEFLARRTGHRFVRLNNHEHTDIQEYLGTYVSDPHTGKLAFQEGVLVKAVRNGHWIVLDELNLAPTDVLEALNRLLDDNRELVIPETQEVVTPHPHFMLFATQNPPGLYGGRKVLSRAFRNRFLEVHFDDVPQAELETIICQRCRIAPSYAQRIVQVFDELRHRRQATRVFESKQSFATLRDLFRWALREAIGYQHLAENGYMLLAERARKDEDKAVVKEVIEKVMKVTINEEALYTISSEETSAYGRLGLPLPFRPDSAVTWTRAMQRLLTLVVVAARYEEPILLVGETGCGKTSVCEVLAQVLDRTLLSVNCYQNMETADLLGSQRPVRNRLERLHQVAQRLAEVTTSQGITLDIPADVSADWCHEQLRHLLNSNLPAVLSQQVQELQSQLQSSGAMFEWHDGPLVKAMRTGDILLLDEVSLADDSVLERLNSVLEPSRTLVLAEQGGPDVDALTVVGSPGFMVVSTMNPGGDFGKKELSPALRNRFTEIWVPALTHRPDLLQIINATWKDSRLVPHGPLILDYVEWFKLAIKDDGKSGIGMRDILAWVTFTNAAFSDLHLGSADVFIHAAEMTIIDGLETIPGVAGLSKDSLAKLRKDCLDMAVQTASSLAATSNGITGSVSDGQDFSVGEFSVTNGPHGRRENQTYSLQAPTTRKNAMRILRACQLPKAILLEGSPGVGKTTIIQALANASGHDLCRINLSDQTDLVDLFGSDLPVIGGKPGEFAWRDAAFLTALKQGDWVLLDEMNLASQAILEGLNAVLDHRGTVYIPELGRSFIRHPDFRIFAAQNPMQQGGGRKGLPKSFLNRFTKVYVKEHEHADLVAICDQLFPNVEPQLLRQAIDFNSRLANATMHIKAFGQSGSPWEFNLRDILRWLQLHQSRSGLETRDDLAEFIGTIYLRRFRTLSDQQEVARLFEDVFHIKLDLQKRPWFSGSPTFVQVGHSLVPRFRQKETSPRQLHTVKNSLMVEEALLQCISSNWLAILAGPAGAGKRSMIRSVADQIGRTLQETTMHSGVDTMEMLGSFEQTDYILSARSSITAVETLLVGEASTPCSTVEDFVTRDTFLARLRNAPTAKDHMAAELDHTAAALVWHLARFGPSEASAQASQSVQESKASLSSAARFEWIDGPLVTAMRMGHWFLISDANLCSSSVLDRLNSLCEPNGTLVLSEKGTDVTGSEEIVPHPHFRLVLAFDPKHGELSRAMRNRGIELFVGSNSLLDTTTENPMSFEFAREAEGARILSHVPMLLSQPLEIGQHPTLSHAQFARILAGRNDPRGVLAYRYMSHFDRSLQQSLAAAVSPETTEVIFEVSQHLTIQRSSSSSWHEFAKTSIPIDFTINEQFGDDSMLRVISQSFALLIGNHWDHAFAVKYVQESEEGANTILCQSMQALRRPIVRGQPDFVMNNLYPGLVALRGHLQASLHQQFLVFDKSEAKAQLKVLEQLADILTEVEAASLAPEINHSAFNVYFKWVHSIMGDVVGDRNLANLLRGLQSAVTTSTGMGQTEIWKSFIMSPPSAAVTIIVESLLKSLAEKAIDSRIALPILDTIGTLRYDDTDSASDYQFDIDELKSVISKLPVRNDSASLSRDFAPLSVLHLRGIRESLYALPESNAISLLIESLNHSYIDVTGLLPLSHIAAVAGEAPLNLVFSAVSDWLACQFERSSNPVDMMSPVLLSSTLDSSGKRRLRDLPVDDLKWSLLVKMVKPHLEQPSEPRKFALLMLSVRVLVNVVQAFAGSFTAADVVLLNEFQAQPDSLSTRLASLVSCIGRSSSVPLLEGFNRTVKPICNTILSDWPDVRLANLGDLWMAISHLVVDLFVTSIPIDPSVAQLCQIQVLDRRMNRLGRELEVYQSAETSLTGNATSAGISAIDEELAQLKALRDIAAKGAMKRDNAIEANTNLGTLFTETARFLAEVCAPAKLHDLARSLAEDKESSQALARERDFQLASAAFLNRLSATYSSLDDLVKPLQFAVYSAKMGIAIHAHAAQSRQASGLLEQGGGLLGSLLAYPTVASASAVCAVSGQTWSSSVSNVTSPLYAELAARTYAVCIGHAVVDHLQSVSRCYDRISYLWHADRERERVEEQAAESLYRQRKTQEDVKSDLEAEAEEFAQLFPSYEDADGLLVEDLMQSDVLADASRTTQIHPDHERQVYQLHLLLFGKDSTATAGMSVFDHQRTGITRLVLRSSNFWDAEIDSLSLPYQAKILSDMQTAGLSVSSDIMYNFYLSPNAPQAKLGYELLHRLRSRLKLLIDEWPEQMVLQHLHERCESMLNMSTLSPVAQYLPAFEQLLTHSEDWEAFANKDNSLRVQQREIIDLIVAWRRLELSCWVNLLPQQASRYEEEVGIWWFKLYRLLVTGPLTLSLDDEVVAESIEDYLKQVLPLLDEYLRASTTGHFMTRLSLLRSFGEYTQLLSAIGSGENTCLAAVATIIRSICRYFGQFETAVTQRVASQKAEIEKTVKDFVKVASWKDINVQALKASAKKTHGQLFKSIRKYREVLKAPVRPLLVNQTQEVTATTYLATGLVIPAHNPLALDLANASRSTDMNAPRHFRLLSATAQRFEEVLGRLDSFSVTDAHETFESLATDIVETTQALAKETPSTANAENAKLVKSLATRKRKALADLLKELKRLGFSGKVSQSQLDKQTSPYWLAQVSGLCDSAQEDATTSAIDVKSESYHNRLQTLLPVMRASLANHSDDILTQDLERAQGFAESVFSMALRTRSRYSESASHLFEIRSLRDRFDLYVQHGPARHMRRRPILHVHERIITAVEALREALQTCKSVLGLYPLDGATILSAQEGLQTLHSAALAIQSDLASLAGAADKGFCNMHHEETRHIDDASEFLSSLGQDLEGILLQAPILTSFLRPISVFLSESSEVLLLNGAGHDTVGMDEILDRSDDVIGILMVAAQESAKAQDVAIAMVDSDKHSATVMYEQQLKDLNGSLRAATVLDKLRELDACVAKASADIPAASTTAAFQRTLPFLNAYLAFADFYRTRQALLLKSSYKLTYILASTFVSIAEKGFCKPSEAQTDASKGGQEQPSDGTGMGAGSGAQDVSNEIEDESQVEGLQGEKEEDPDENPAEKNGDEEDNALEMDDDFGGNLEDAEDDGEESGDSDGGDDEADDTMDDHVGDVEQGVDEQFWGDDKGESADQDDKLNEDRAEENGESEMVGKDEEDPKPEGKQKPEKKESEGIDDKNGPEDSEQQDDVEEDSEDPAADQENAPEDDGRGGEAFDPHVPDNETLDLPDDLKIDDNEPDSDMDISGEDDGLDEDEDTEEGDGEQDAEGRPTEQDDSGSDMDDDNEENGADFAEPGEQDMPEEDLSNAQNADIQAGTDDMRDVDMGGPQRGTEAGELDQERKDETADDNPEGEADEEKAEDNKDGQQGGTTSGDTGGEDQASGGKSDQQRPKPQQSETDRSKSLGDKVKEVRRLAEEILERSENAETETKDNEAPESRPGEVEHIRDDEDEEMQALGSADANQQQTLADLHIVDDDEPQGVDNPAMDIDDDELPENSQRQDDRTADGPSQPPPADNDVSKALTRAEVEAEAEKSRTEGRSDELADPEMDIDMPLAEEDVEESADLEMVMQDWVHAGREIQTGEALWRRYSAITNDLSHVLCEQLRLILEPTLATRMQGDYRTGKRLNMRKIIPYIASEYTKDKIWLRRTKPSRREYQVMISLDDSRSMADSHSVHLAYQTLALVAQALTKLEVGQISIARFGEGVEILHPFADRGFTDADGAKVMNSFGFDQHKTDVAELVERSLTVLSEARQSQSGSTAPDLWQLEIIVSDGVCQDHPRLRTLLRRAMEERIMIVFLVLDSLQRTPQTGTAAATAAARTSILSMQTVSYQQVNGEMQIEMQRYLDTFPFEYYVVLRDVEALPDTLAEILRQWLSRVAASEE